jgi:FkbM family methyltransferase
MFLVPVADQAVGAALRRDGVYGFDELALLSKLVSPQSRVLVVGAHVGSIAIPLSRSCSSLSAVEANPKTLELLRCNVKLNDVTNLVVKGFAASDKAGSIEFVLNTDNSGGSKIRPAHFDFNYRYDSPDVVVVPTNRLDDEIADDFDLVVMDIEGSEVFALRGMPRILSKASALVVEFIPHHITRVANASVPEFLAPIEAAMNFAYVPTKNVILAQSKFESFFSQMAEKNEVDDGVVFSKDIATCEKLLMKV